MRQTMRNLLDGLEEAGMNFADVVATNVYLDEIGEFTRMNKIYGEYFGATPPARTTIQTFPSVERKPSRARNVADLRTDLANRREVSIG